MRLYESYISLFYPPYAQLRAIQFLSDLVTATDPIAVRFDVGLPAAARLTRSDWHRPHARTRHVGPATRPSQTRVGRVHRRLWPSDLVPAFVPPMSSASRSGLTAAERAEEEELARLKSSLFRPSPTAAAAAEAAAAGEDADGYNGDSSRLLAAAESSLAQLSVDLHGEDGQTSLDLTTDADRDIDFDVLGVDPNRFDELEADMASKNVTSFTEYREKIEKDLAQYEQMCVQDCQSTRDTHTQQTTGAREMQHQCNT